MCSSNYISMFGFNYLLRSYIINIRHYCVFVYYNVCVLYTRAHACACFHLIVAMPDRVYRGLPVFGRSLVQTEGGWVFPMTGAHRTSEPDDINTAEQFSTLLGAKS
jgi:hypothetical protein